MMQDSFTERERPRSPLGGHKLHIVICPSRSHNTQNVSSQLIVRSKHCGGRRIHIHLFARGVYTDEWLKSRHVTLKFSPFKPRFFDRQTRHQDAAFYIGEQQNHHQCARTEASAALTSRVSYGAALPHALRILMLRASTD